MDVGDFTEEPLEDRDDDSLIQDWEHLELTTHDLQKSESMWHTWKEGADKRFKTAYTGESASTLKRRKRRQKQASRGSIADPASFGVAEKQRSQWEEAVRKLADCDILRPTTSAQASKLKLYEHSKHRAVYLYLQTRLNDVPKIEASQDVAKTLWVTPSKHYRANVIRQWVQEYLDLGSACQASFSVVT
ncbi:hypothetical protein BCR43DRAFT_504148 [Syncephalastrum racemosum]|uniref:Uncharacterized protein n=1 Tax=Syncephalastrum racemosum TaxID=13706 RepID=A0A1X2HE25_SYNRA|nr:hypothetical protein BCR43DRAFT_504148 [Syncephalastrum racemosum]